MRLSGAGFVNVHYFCAAEYLRLPKFSLTNWYIFRENTQFSPKLLLMVLWTEPPVPARVAIHWAVLSWQLFFADLLLLLKKESNPFNFCCGKVY